MPKTSFRATRPRKRAKPGGGWSRFSAAKSALPNLNGGFPATVMGRPSRDRIWRRNRISSPGVETPRRKLEGSCPDSATQLLLAKKFAGMSSRQSLRNRAPWSSMLVYEPLDQNTWESALASSGTRLTIRSHSEAPTRVKRTPASARRYCPVRVQVHRRWIWFSFLIR